MQYNLLKPWETLDPWQKEVLETEGNLCIRTGRQVGKSTIISIKAGEYALKNANQTVMVIASVERQAHLIFEKILSYIHTKNKNAIKTGKDRPTKSILKLKNGTKILCLPTGDSGYGIRGYTINLLIADEAAFIAEEVWTAVIPTLTITKGVMWLLSTPHGREGFYYRCFSDPKFRTFHISSWDCPRRDEDFLTHEREWMTKAQYAQEYLGEFVDDLRQFFPDELIAKCCVGKRPTNKIRGTYFYGVDVARKDRDEFTHEIMVLRNGKLIHVENIVTRNVPLPSSAVRIMDLDKFYDCKKIYVDSGGMGIAICDILRDEDSTKRKVVEINNASRIYSRGTFSEKERKKKLMKEELYKNLLMLMQQGKVTFLDDPEIKLSLKSIQFEYPMDRKGDMIIWGNYSHIAEGLIRAAWGIKDKGLNIWIR